MSVKKPSLKKPSKNIPFKDLESKVTIVYYPTSTDLDLCEQHMEMKDMKDKNSEVFKKMPKSVHIHGKSVPRTALRKRDLCHLYMLLGGKIIKKPPKILKHYTQSKKPSKEQKKYPEFIDNQEKDHNKKNTNNSVKKSSLKKTSQPKSGDQTKISNKKPSIKKEYFELNLPTNGNNIVSHPSTTTISSTPFSFKKKSSIKKEPVKKPSGDGGGRDGNLLSARFKSMKLNDTDTPSSARKKKGSAKETTLMKTKQFIDDDSVAGDDDL